MVDGVRDDGWMIEMKEKIDDGLMVERERKR
jgi:hypothetical protein